MTPEDVAQIMAAHIQRWEPRSGWVGGGFWRCGKCEAAWPCLPWRLAAALVERDQRIAAVRKMAEEWRKLDDDGYRVVSSDEILAAIGDA